MKTVYVIKAFNAKGEVISERTRTLGKREAKSEYERAISGASRFGGYATCEPDPFVTVKEEVKA